MSCVIVLAPIVIAAWPVLAASVVAAAASCGFKVVKDAKKIVAKQKVDLQMENSEVVAESLSLDDKIVVERQGVRVTFSRDVRGQFSTCVEGAASKDELKAIGEDISGRVIQQYMYRRLSEELKNQGFDMLSQEQGTDEAIRLHVRRYQE